KLTETKVFLSLLIVGFFAVIVFSLGEYNQTGKINNAIIVFAESAMIAGASCMVGAFFGFIFGIPKTNHESKKVDTVDESTSEKELSYPNTNLEEISDWLTKILVGAGITQISGAPGYLWRVSGEMGRQIPFYKEGLVKESLINPQVFVFSSIIYFSVVGFFVSFFWARIYLPKRMHENRLRKDLDLLKYEYKEYSKEAENNAYADSLVEGILEGQEIEIDQKELETRINLASFDKKRDIFRKAREIRHNNWEFDKITMARVIPIFTALLATKHGKDDYEINAQLGYCYKDMNNPDYNMAKQLLSKAIKIRDDNGHGDLKRFYEFNRAYCSIELDPNLPKGEPAEEGIKNEIIADLKIASQDDRILNIMKSLDIVKKWIEVNNGKSEFESIF
ncbi:MAG: hypothetical protein OEY50_10565, partial [Nitrospinota bacterium]|nr:hypothetical protein [Nitrospinota bacterium]